MTQLKHDYLGTPADVIAIPQVHNNPGDLENLLGQKIVFETEADGWDALYRQIELMISGRSKIYKPTMSWHDIGAHYDGEANFINWVNNVCKKLGVQPTQTLQQFVDSFHIVKPIGIAVKDSMDFGDSVG